MTVRLGVDTGGTYTDAVLMDEDDRILATAKALTTRHDLAVGVAGAVSAVLQRANLSPQRIRMAALSTTLATNALVEGHGGRVALIFIGFRRQDLEAQGLMNALGGDPFLILEGGHGPGGEEITPLDETALETFIHTEAAGITGFAVAGRFATRNPAHEERVAAIISEKTGRPVSASHHLSARLGGPKRALTAVLNARLIGMIDALISRTESKLRELGIDAPLQVVRGDGALMRAETARARPIETILSGPAASIVGAQWLTSATEALVSDIGGTTTDIAYLRNGRPEIDPDGAIVGLHRTMVEAVAMRTFGLGGDSEVHPPSSGLHADVTLGPRRVLPLSLIASEAPESVIPPLQEALRKAVPGAQDGRFARRTGAADPVGLGTRESALLDRLSDKPLPLDAVLKRRMDISALRKLVDRGLVQIAGLTPSDAAHAVGLAEHWNGEAAELGLSLMARHRSGAGEYLARSAKEMAWKIIQQLQAQTETALLQCAFAADGGFALDSRALANHPLMQAGLTGHAGVVRIASGVNVPIVGLGASAASYYPAVGQKLGTEMLVPSGADVANAIGAVVGRVRANRKGTITVPGAGRFRAHLETGPKDFTEFDPAKECLLATLRAAATHEAEMAGVDAVEIDLECDENWVEIEGSRTLITAEFSVTAHGRPAFTASR